MSSKRDEEIPGKILSRTSLGNQNCPGKSKTHGHLVSFAFCQVMSWPFYRRKHVLSANHSWCWHWTGDRLEWWTISRCVSSSVSFPLQTIIFLTETTRYSSDITRNIVKSLILQLQSQHTTRGLPIWKALGDLGLLHTPQKWSDGSEVGFVWLSVPERTEW